MSNYTQLGFIKQTDGENEGSWGDALNENLIDLLDDAIGGYVEVSVASGNVTLAFADGTADNNGRHATIKFTGSPGTTRTVTFPDAQVNYFIINGSDGSVICTSGSGAATVTIPTGMKDVIYIDGSDEVLSMFGTPHLSSSGNFTVDATTDIILDADGGDIFFKDGGTTFGSATNTSGNLIIKSGTTTAATFSGANVTLAGTVGSGAITSTGIVAATELDISGNMDIDGTSNLDNTDIDGTFAVDGTTISMDATTSLNIDNSNTSNGITIGTATSGVPISIGHTTSETTINDNATVTGNLSVGGTFDVTGTIDFSDSAITNAGDIQLDSITGDGDTNTAITFSGSDVITIKTGGSNRLTIGDGALSPSTDNEIDLGTSSLEFKNAYFDGTVTSDAFAGPLTGDVTGNVSGTAATVTTAAQSNITSLGTLTTLTVDNVIVNGTTIGHTSDTDLITLADGIATVAGEVSMTTLDIGGTNVTTTAAELNLIDGGTARGTDALADGDGILINDGGTMKMTNVTAVKTYMAGSAASAGFALAMAVAL